MAICLYGGSFDPIHLGHLIIASNVVEKLNLEKLIFIPTNKTPLKSSALCASNTDRYNMIKESIKNNASLDISDYEISKDRVSYTYHTVNYFREQYKNQRIYFLIGTDRIKDLQHWYKIEALSALVTFIFTRRNGENIEEIILKDEFYKTINYVILDLPIVEISSTYVRDKIKHQKNFEYLVSYGCSNYIKEKKLYEF